MELHFKYAGRPWKRAAERSVGRSESGLSVHKGDQSILILLYGVATILVSVLMVFAWRGALQSAYKAECLAKEGKHVNTFGEDLKSLLHEICTDF